MKIWGEIKFRAFSSENAFFVRRDLWENVKFAEKIRRLNLNIANLVMIK